MARKKQGDISTFLQQAQGLQSEAAKAAPMYANVVKGTADAQNKQVANTKSKTQEVAKNTSADNIANTAGLQYNTESYATPGIQKSVQTSPAITPDMPTNLDNMPSLGTMENQITPELQKAADAAKLNGNQAITTMGNVRKAWLDGDKAGAEAAYKQFFGTAMPDTIRAQLGAGLGGINEYLKDPKAGFGQFRQLSAVEQQAKKAAELGQEPVTALSGLYGMKGPSSALDVQASLPQLNQLSDMNKRTTDETAARGLQKKSAIDDYLTEQSTGRKNVDAFKKDVAAKTEAERKGIDKLVSSEIQSVASGFESKYKNAVLDTVGKVSTQMDDILSGKINLPLVDIEHIKASLIKNKENIPTKQYKELLDKIAKAYKQGYDALAARQDTDIDNFYGNKTSYDKPKADAQAATTQTIANVKKAANKAANPNQGMPGMTPNYLEIR